MVSPSQLFKEINAGKFKPAYYFYGSEDFRITEAEKFVARKFLPDKQLMTNFYRLDGRKSMADDVVMTISTLPMLGERQVFAISEFQSFRPKEVESLLKLLNPPDPSRVVIFSSPSQRMPKKSTSFFKSVTAVTQAVEFNRLTIEESTRMAHQRLQKENISIDPEALRLLVELVSGSKGGLENELNKLCNYKQVGETISIEDIKQITSGYGVFNVFAVADLIVAGDTPQVMKTVAHLVAEGNSPVTIVTLIQQHFLSLYLVKNGKPPMGNRGFLLQKFRDQAARFDNDQLEQAILDIATADSELRQAKLKPQTQVEVLALKLVESVKSRHG